MLSDRLWQRRFAADPEIIGRQITLDGFGYEVIGVMPAAFEHRLMPASDVWRSLQYDRTLPSLAGPRMGTSPAHGRATSRRRVAPGRRGGTGADRARPDRAVRPRRPGPPMPQGLLVDSLHGDLTRDAGRRCSPCVAAVGFLLLIACVNVVNLLLGRDAQRRAEFAMRTALGAGRARLIRQLLTETLLLAVLGGAAGLLVALAFARALMRLGPQGLPGAASVTLDTSLFLLAFAVTTIVGLLVGLIPAIGNARSQGRHSTGRLAGRLVAPADAPIPRGRGNRVCARAAGWRRPAVPEPAAAVCDHAGLRPAQRADHAGASRWPAVSRIGP